MGNTQIAYFTFYHKPRELAGPYGLFASTGAVT